MPNSQYPLDERLRLREHAIHSISEGITISNPALPDNPIVYANSGFEKITGYSIPEILGHNCRFLQGTDTDPAAVQTIRESLQREESCTVELINYRKNGTPFWNYLSISPVLNNDGQLTHFVGIQYDITQRKLLEQELIQRADELETLNERLQQSESELTVLNANKDKFFSIISHDLKSPFHSLMGFSEILSGDLNSFSREEIQDFGKHIHTTTQQLFNLLDNLLQWSRLQTGKLEYRPTRIELFPIVSNTIALLQGNALRKQIQLNCDFDSTLTAYADGTMVQLILQNLVSNSIKFTPFEGKIHIFAELQDDFVELSVGDSGVGIDKETLPKLFKIEEPCSTVGTNNETGTGLGLVLCKELVEKNGGTIGVDSEPNKGSRFWFTLPRSIHQQPFYQ